MLLGLSLAWLLAAPPALAAQKPLVIGCGADRYSKAKHYLSFAKGGPNAWITEPLVFRGDDYRPRPGLVERWERQGNKYRLSARKGVRFHNGAEWDAAALQRALEINAFNRSETLRIKPESYRIIDKYTLELETAHQTVHFAGFLSHPFVAAYAPGTDFINHPVGTGPFVFESYRRGSYLKVRRNDDYWGDKPPNRQVIYRFLPDPQTRLLALLNGECDIIFPVDPQMLASLPPEGQYKKVVTPLRSYVVMSVNWHGQAPFDLLRDSRLRRAVAYAIDRKVIAQTVYQGLARPAKSILAPWFWDQGEEFLKGYGYDPAKAKRLLNQAGWKPGPDGIRVKDGRRLKLRLVSGFPTGADLKPLPELMQQMLLAVGIEVEVIQTDDMGMYYGSYMAPGQGDLFLEKSGNTSPTPAWLLYLLYHSDSPWVDSGYKWVLPGPKFDRAVERAQLSDDPEVVRGAIQEAQRVLVDETCSVIPLLFVANVYLVRPEVELDPSPTGGYEHLGYARKKR
ncbi:MAG: hypothetical protein K9K66_11890 [Desulfarculaceae bacterium]|nr:hypothetical protein [Desulfarculaceae bacterium]MCF8071532.1 hypothetical protein [Desulfarculaceae bacterium]MCF8102347.1 hypothetical protein [Desulfarculaceae bacterium]MCF8114811.1 hypothetical protein [Desulfarculaceae bacterium]